MVQEKNALTAPSLLLTRRLPMFSMPMFFTNSRTLSSYTRACAQQPQFKPSREHLLSEQAPAKSNKKAQPVYTH